MTRRSNLTLAIGFAVSCAVAAAIALRDPELPGVYYDEVIQADPAVRFLDGSPPHELPGATQTRLFGRWFPLAIQPYMGALKSQALIPVFALFGATPTSLRATTLAWALAGLGLLLLFARREYSLGVALLAGALLACDPNFLFISRHDWGSFALGFACRCGALYALASGWRERSLARMFAGGLLLGLGLYNKIDFGVFIAGAGLALLAVVPSLVGQLVRREGRARAIAAIAGLAVGSAPLAMALGRALTTTRAMFARQIRAGGDWNEKLDTLLAMLDGSYFHRLMLSGGSFERMHEIEGAAAGPFVWILGLAAAWIAAQLLLRRPWGPADRAHAFALFSAVFVTVGVLLTPRAVRIHHALLAFPFPQLVVAIAAVDVGTRLARTGPARVAGWAGVAILVAPVLLGQLRVDLRILETLRHSEGKGRWSNRITRLGSELAANPQTVAVSLDWGFHLPLRFTAPDLAAIEPIWRLRTPAGRNQWQLRGSPEYVYLVFPEEYAVFEHGAAFLQAVDALPPGRAAIRHHTDGDGDLAFVSVRFAATHELRYRRGFEIRLLE